MPPTPTHTHTIIMVLLLRLPPLLLMVLMEGAVQAQHVLFLLLALFLSPYPSFTTLKGEGSRCRVLRDGADLAWGTSCSGTGVCSYRRDCIALVLPFLLANDDV